MVGLCLSDDNITLNWTPTATLKWGQNMAQLSDIPAVGLQVILRHLASQDYASLRLVSRSVHECITQHTPYINLLLSNTSRAEQLHQWYQATAKLKHVSSVHVHFPRGPAAQVFELAMQLLSHRTQITELQLLGAQHCEGAWNTYCTSGISTLQPIECLLPNLRTLVVEGVTVSHMVNDLQQLAAAAAVTGGWQLQSLTLRVEWRPISEYDHWSEYSAALKYLTQTFPWLSYLSLQQPNISCSLLPSAAAAADNPEEPAAVGHGLMRETDILGRIGEVTALANAVLQLQHLEVLHVTIFLDVWSLAPVDSGDIGGLMAMLRSECRNVSNSDLMEAVAIADELTGDGSISSVLEAAAAFPTLDDYGCWLLQHHPMLLELHMSFGSANSDWGMTWQRQQTLCRGSISSRADVSLTPSAAATEASAVTSIKCSFSMYDRAALTMYGETSTIRAGHGSSSSSSSALSYDFARHMSRYSSRPADVLFRNITTCRLMPSEQDVAQLGDLLRNLRSLRHLQICLQPSRRQKGGDTVRGAAAVTVAGIFSAAATVTGLQSLDVWFPGEVDGTLSDDLLLPLTAAAGGPGSSLEKLTLRGPLASPVRDTVRAAEYGSGWLDALQHLAGLRQLQLVPKCSKDGNMCNFCVEWLPAGLEVFRGCDLLIASAAAETHDGFGRVAVTVPPHSGPTLSALFLERCVLSTPRVLASGQLQQLIIMDSRWSGGWAAAASAWPHLRSLRWTFDSSCCDSSSSSSHGIMAMMQQVNSKHQNVDIAMDSSEAIVAGTKHLVQGVMHDISVAFGNLAFIALHRLPCLSIEILQPLLQQLHYLKHIEFESTQACGRDYDVDPMMVQLTGDITQQLPWASARLVGSNSWMYLKPLGLK